MNRSANRIFLFCINYSKIYTIMKNYFLTVVLMLTSFSVSAQSFKSDPFDYDPTEEKNISVNTTYDFSDSIVKKVFVTVTNKSQREIRVIASGRVHGTGDLIIYFMDVNEKEVQEQRLYPLMHNIPETNQKIILKPGKSETFEYRVYAEKNGILKKIKIDYHIKYRFMDEEPLKVLFFRKKTEPVDIY